MYENAYKVFTCCGKHIAVTKSYATSGKIVKCPSCGKNLTAPVNVPKIVIVK